MKTMEVIFSDLTEMAFKKLMDNKMVVKSLSTDEQIRLRQHGLICPNTEDINGGEVLTSVGVRFQQFFNGDL